MSGVKRMIHRKWSTSAPSILRRQPYSPINPHHDNFIQTQPRLSQMISARFLDFYQLGNKTAIEKERARLSDEMNRGYFADLSELKQHGGKIGIANKVIIPAVEALKFPALEVGYPDGRTIKLPIPAAKDDANANNPATSKVSLICLSFRANSQAMVDSWCAPFVEALKDSKDIHLYEISFIDSWFLSLKPIKWLLIRTMKKSKPDGNNTIQKQTVYSFGDHYYFRKELKILNLLTGYIFLLDKSGRIRWQGSGIATEEEMSTLQTCTSALLKEK